jgi:hypothetical protein
VNLIITASVITYLLISLYFAKNWFNFFKSSSTPSPQNYFLSFIILIVITISWPLMLPLYLITSLASFIVKRLFTTKPKNTYFYQTVTPLPLTVTPVCQSEKF